MVSETLQQEIWRKAIDSLENDLLRICPMLSGGKKGNETAEQYAARCINEINRAVGRLSEAREEYREVGGLP